MSETAHQDKVEHVLKELDLNSLHPCVTEGVRVLKSVIFCCKSAVGSMISVELQNECHDDRRIEMSHYNITGSILFMLEAKGCHKCSSQGAHPDIYIICHHPSVSKISLPRPAASTSWDNF